MKKDIVYRAIGEVNPDYLDEFEEMEKKTMKKSYKGLCAAACLVLLMGAGVVTGLTDLPENVSSFLGMEDETQIKYLANAASSVDLLVEGEQGDVHIKEVMGDSNAIYVFFDYIASEGTILDKNHYKFLWEDPSIKQNELMYQVYQLEDEDKTDNKLSFAFHIKTEKSLEGEEISLRLASLCGYDDEEFNTHRRDMIQYDQEKMIFVLDEEYIMENHPEILGSVVIYEEIWKSEPFKATFTDHSNEYKVKHSVTSDGIEYTLTKVSISPFALTFQGEVKADSDKVLDKRVSDITVHYADGTSEELESSGSLDLKTFTFSYTCNFLPLLTQEIVAVTYMGERIELSA
ncbi:MAG: hypothetical protein R3Y07_07190 [Eubacteriales bacterium]